MSDEQRDREPVSRGRRDFREQGFGPLRTGLLPALVFAIVVLVNAVLFVLLVGLLQAIGWWASESADGALSAISTRLRLADEGGRTPSI